MLEEYLSLFISETETYIMQLEKEVLALEKNNKKHDSILEVFRILHTIKGMAQTMGFEELGNLAHSVEDLLIEPKARGEIDKKVIEFLFIIIDYFSQFLKSLKNNATCPPAGELLGICEDIKQGKEVVLKKSITGGPEFGEIRIKISKIDNLFNLVNELLIVKSRLAKLSSKSTDGELLSLNETAGRLISVLQDEMMKLRMLPLSTVFEFFPRWLRDEAKKQNKEIELEIIGSELEVDRSVIDILKEPIMHLLRNALDHGIEKKGKIILHAQREKEFIRISVSDDGRGIDPDEIRRLAVKKILLIMKQHKN